MIGRQKQKRRVRALEQKLKDFRVRFELVTCPKPKCGKLFQITTPHETYSQELGPSCVAICDMCGITIPSNDAMLHCEKSNTEGHSGGYDLCVKCGEVRKKQEKRLQSVYIGKLQKQKHNERIKKTANNNNNNTSKNINEHKQEIVTKKNIIPPKKDVKPTIKVVLKANNIPPVMPQKKEESKVETNKGNQSNKTIKPRLLLVSHSKPKTIKLVSSRNNTNSNNNNNNNNSISNSIKNNIGPLKVNTMIKNVDKKVGNLTINKQRKRPFDDNKTINNEITEPARKKRRKKPNHLKAHFLNFQKRLKSDEFRDKCIEIFYDEWDIMSKDANKYNDEFIQECNKIFATKYNFSGENHHEFETFSVISKFNNIRLDVLKEFMIKYGTLSNDDLNKIDKNEILKCFNDCTQFTIKKKKKIDEIEGVYSNTLKKETDLSMVESNEDDDEKQEYIIARFAIKNLIHNYIDNNKLTFNDILNEMDWSIIPKLIEESHFYRDWKITKFREIVEKQIVIINRMIEKVCEYDILRLLLKDRVIVWKKQILTLYHGKKIFFRLQIPFDYLSINWIDINRSFVNGGINELEPYIRDKDKKRQMQATNINKNVKPIDTAKLEQAYATKQYWDEFHNQHNNEPFEWFCNYKDIKDIIETKIINKNAKILEIGCGSSNMANEMVLQSGFTNIMCLDWCQHVINQNIKYTQEMYKNDTKKLNKLRQCIHYIVRDIRNMDFKNRTFDVVIDKGTLDAIDCGNDIKMDGSNNNSNNNGNNSKLSDNFSDIVDISSRIHTILKPNGLFIIVTSRSIPKRIEFINELKSLHKRHFKKIFGENIATDLKDFRDGDRKSPKIIILCADKSKRKKNI